MPQIDEKTLKTITIAGKSFKVSPVIYQPLLNAERAFFAATGKHLNITSAYRSTETQAALYKKMKAENPRARVSPPGYSFHEKGQAVDVWNYKEAEKFLRAEGFQNPLSDDKIHFSIGEFKAVKQAAGGIAGLLVTAGIVYFLAKFLMKGN